MDMPLLRAFVELKLFLLILISSACMGDDCSSGAGIVTSPSNASILQGSNHTFLCKAIGSDFIIKWKINDTFSYELPEDSNFKKVDVDVMPYNDGCGKESPMIVHTESAPEHNTSSTFVIQCVMEMTHSQTLVSKAYLKLHVIGGAGDVELLSSASPNGPSIIQWKAPDVLSGRSSPLYYNITVRDPSNQVIAQSTTTDTSFAIGSDLLVPCHSHELTLIPFQHISGHPELGLITQETLLPPPLPPTIVNLSVSVRPDSVWVTIHFQAQPTNCSLQWPESFIVTVMQHGPDEIFQLPKQTVKGVENKYTLEKLNLRQKYQVSIKLEKNISSSIAEIANFSTFNVQNLTLTEQEGGHDLNVHCDMAEGAEGKNCIVMMRSETGVLPWNCLPTSGRNATCKLSELSSGQYMIQGYDQEWEETPAVEHAFLFTKTSSECLTNTAPPTRTDDTTTLESSPSRIEDGDTVQNGFTFGIVASLLILVFIAAGLASIVVAVVVIKFHTKKQECNNLHASQSSQTEVHLYRMAEENEYDEHSIPQQQDAPTESTVVQTYAEAQTPILENAYDERGLSWQQDAVDESTDVQEPAYADVQTTTRTTATTNNSHNQYREHRKEWLAHLRSEASTLPHTPRFSHTPDNTSL